MHRGSDRAPPRGGAPEGSRLPMGMWRTPWIAEVEQVPLARECAVGQGTYDGAARHQANAYSSSDSNTLPSPGASCGWRVYRR